MLIYNSKTHKKEEFVPHTAKRVEMYVCGPTVYDEIHIGNARTFLSFDLVRRYLKYKGYEVVFAQNLTDIDDKIIARANEQKRTAADVAASYSAAFIEQMHRFGILDPDIRPRATHEIPEMQHMITQLIDQGHAYVAENGDVYFSVRSDHNYGEISGRNVDDMRAGERVEISTIKRDPLDFALWKAAKPGEPSWESPWGAGRPGWHTECAAMIHRYFGDTIDIHAGGQDLMFPHHENENAQARCAWGNPLAKVWMHAGMLRVNGEKMSKSLGNFYTLKEVLDSYPADALRLLMLQTHYRSSLDFSFERLKGACGTLNHLAECIKNLEWAARHADTSTPVGEDERGLSNFVDTTESEFCTQMDDDFNSAAALAALFALVVAANKYLELHGEKPSAPVLLRTKDMLLELFGVLGIESIQDQSAHVELPQEVCALAKTYAELTTDNVDEAAAALLNARTQARKEKNYQLSDAIRDSLAAIGLVVEDTAQGTRLKRSE